MPDPTPRILLASLGLAKAVNDPEFVVAGIEAKVPGPFTRVIFDRLVYVNFTQIFRSSATFPGDARADVEKNLVRALNWGLQHEGGEGFARERFTAGLEFLEEYVGAAIDPAFCRLAILRPFEVRHFPRRDPTPEEDRKSTRLNSSHIQKSRMPSSA